LTLLDLSATVDNVDHKIMLSCLETEVSVRGTAF